MYLPIIKKYNIFFSYLSCNKCNKGDEQNSLPITFYSSGVCLSDINQRNKFFDNLSREISLKSIKSNTECVEKICQIIYHYFYDENNNEYINVNDELKKLLEEKEISLKN